MANISNGGASVLRVSIDAGPEVLAMGAAKMKNHSPIIVTGCGFCGTNAVVKYLKDECGVFMGSKWTIPALDAQKRYEIWEDAEWYSAFIYKGRPIAECIADLVIARQHYKHWGFKVADSHLKIKQYLPHFDAPRFILCNRDTNELVTRMIEQWGMTAFQAQYRIEEYRAVCKTIRSFYQYVDIDQTELLNYSKMIHDRIGDFVKGD